MATSGSPEWTARALLFSGRPDPTWPVPESAATEVHALWAALDPWSGAPSAAPPLGYRGCILRAPDGREWMAFGGAVTLTRPEGYIDAQGHNPSPGICCRWRHKC